MLPLKNYNESVKTKLKVVKQLIEIYVEVKLVIQQKEYNNYMSQLEECKFQN